MKCITVILKMRVDRRVVSEYWRCRRLRRCQHTLAYVSIASSKA